MQSASKGGFPPATGWRLSLLSRAATGLGSLSVPIKARAESLAKPRRARSRAWHLPGQGRRAGRQAERGQAKRPQCHGARRLAKRAGDWRLPRPGLGNGGGGGRKEHVAPETEAWQGWARPGSTAHSHLHPSPCSPSWGEEGNCERGPGGLFERRPWSYFGLGEIVICYSRFRAARSYLSTWRCGRGNERERLPSRLRETAWKFSWCAQVVWCAFTVLEVISVRQAFRDALGLFSFRGSTAPIGITSLFCMKFREGEDKKEFEGRRLSRCRGRPVTQRLLVCFPHGCRCKGQSRLYSPQSTGGSRCLVQEIRTSSSNRPL
ncbi:uncharacterized protein LOC141505068 [Macrotis lagotis]|uniref:uncharacterized protein LOC141505068 n=1 Tax=Macrotis lagotis TaxID=92651 RepID=UPI003D69E769